eukprot:TRINITY_DN44745_c0_g1_i1.p2 TRINITY_DN44745_c0_g1~~TRINITY_DN44745_c0_g1_i1.p2  ORF type:complete len:126 (+),score=30.19 TRINITY_DN44745_c0_g1_i1:137-514(+)
MLRSLVGSEMCIRDRYQRRVRGVSAWMASDQASLQWSYDQCMQSRSFLDESKFCILGVAVGVAAGVKTRGHMPWVYGGIAGTVADLYAGRSACSREKQQLDDFLACAAEVTGTSQPAALHHPPSP